MSGSTLRDQLSRLHALILEERECAKRLAMDELMAATREKEALLAEMGTVEELGPEERHLAEAIRRDNRRNAYLFWTTLRWVRESMEFFHQKTSQVSYGAAGSLVNSSAGGRLLSGKV
jgi:flagellar biosynthesis/type III secretory pathway chaperone